MLTKVFLAISVVVFAAGVCGAVGVAALGAYGLISILYLTVQSNPLSIRRYKIFILITKLIFSLVAGKRVEQSSSYNSQKIFQSV